MVGGLAAIVVGIGAVAGLLLASGGGETIASVDTAPAAVTSAAEAEKLPIVPTRKVATVVIKPQSGAPAAEPSEVTAAEAPLPAQTAAEGALTAAASEPAALPVTTAASEASPTEPDNAGSDNGAPADGGLEANDPRWGNVASPAPAQAPAKPADTKLQSAFADPNSGSDLSADLLTTAAISRNAEREGLRAPLQELETLAGDAEEQARVPLPKAVRTARIADGVNMRSAPRPGMRVLTVVPAGASVALVGCEDWCEIIYKGQRGYVYRSFVEGQSRAASRTKPTRTAKAGGAARSKAQAPAKAKAAANKPKAAVARAAPRQAPARAVPKQAPARALVEPGVPRGGAVPAAVLPATPWTPDRPER